ncbi:CRISPR-associated endonuclease Cas2 [Candidatus Roizmanbacteria bacterium CG_4_9_14_3_um_filter_33_18]|uniref:CRISPR-associated endonuclease Cas2 n=3 Tax=Candidatus Roizmaniibacteriota TaxID=1752723 RepID=A0A2M7U6S5_9BACT|nr:MAG: CRISPR-associated endonuclease Cas2 [Candidatus Roizmanbacteria bacterium CG22_combo_CG10-13_8_21_14_all_34_12]PIZ66924.1 MAG: CRISPR-associated endonuclease Cas2 [Candidatus Roizmanbacteria bacterium CG_4_10_14_0_2_um_filter_33_96]PJA55766.1 MAG: CRISPR-associated endonuclease Cas2 [Candidatus Roizmanbacteria bacterium CG_4_9_14_3_um_filter_33_18]
MSKKFKKGEITKMVLATLGIGALLGGTVLITPNFPIIIGTFIKLIEEIKGIKLPKKKVKRALQQLEKRKMLNLEVKDNEVYVEVEDIWNKEIIKYSIQSLLELKQKTKWSGKWFLVMFDVPEIERNKRYYLRNFLKIIGFYQYQQSVYVFPYECEKEVTLIKKIIEGGKYLSYIIAEKIEYENKLKIYFGLPI